jgi:hypothetical protein
MDLFAYGYKDFLIKNNDCRLGSSLCEFNCDKNSVGVYCIIVNDVIVYIGKTDVSIKRRFDWHFNTLFTYWNRRYHKKLSRIKNYSILTMLTNELVNDRKIIVKKLSDDPSHEKILIKKHLPYCNIQYNEISESELKFRKKKSINELRKLKTRFNLYSLN